MSAVDNLAYPDSPYQIVSYRFGKPVELPAGQGGLAMRTWCPARARRSTLAPMVGVDGQPALYGWGEAAIVLPPGDHVVEIQYVEPLASKEVTIRAGEVTPLEYAASRDAIAPGSLGAPPQRAAGTPLLPIGLAIVAALFVFNIGLAVLVAGAHVSLGVAAPALAVMAAGIVVGTVLRTRRGPARRGTR